MVRGMTTTKSSSRHSSTLAYDDSSALSDTSHFEDIGLDDGNTTDARHLRDTQILPSAPNPYSATYPSDLRAASLKIAVSNNGRPLVGARDAPKFRPQRDVTPVSGQRHRPALSTLHTNIRGNDVRSLSMGSVGMPLSPRVQLLSSHSTTSLPYHGGRPRSPSPNSLYPRDPKHIVRQRRSSWQSNRERKSVVELERECDEEDGDDIPEGLILDNVPISPRHTRDRPLSRTASTSPSPSRPPKPVGNGTPAVAAAQGCLRSPSWKASATSATSPVKARAKSWNAAMATLSPETRALTEKLEEHSDEIQQQRARSGMGDKRSNTWDGNRRSLDHLFWEPEQRKRRWSPLPELPNVRHTNVMIDPLPISKEKEAVLSRTRPSWLPPKDPAEEKRHLREYQKMMATSAELDRRRDAARNARTATRDSAADNLQRLWEDEVLPRWNEAVREWRTRELWWKGVAPRSRGAVWTRAIGNELGLSGVSYEAALGRVKEIDSRVTDGRGDPEDVRRAAWFSAIREDVLHSTWPDLRIFQEGGPLHSSLVDVLSAYAVYRSDIGYLKGCNTIAALLLINLPNATDVFIALANILNRPLPLSFYANDDGAKTSAYNLVLQTLKTKCPNLHEHLTQNIADPDPNEYLCDVFTALFTDCLAIDEAARLWDVYVFEGDAILVRAAIALFAEHEMALLGTSQAEEIKAILHGSSGSSSKPRTVGEVGSEDRWMRAVREAGKS